MKEIPLSQGMAAIVDATDYDFLMQWKWYAMKSRHTFYAYRSCRLPDGRKTTIYMHRQIIGFPSVKTDHKDGNGLNNRRCNLRLATRSQNRANTPSIGGASRYKGVHYDKKRQRWIASIREAGKSKRLGRFKTQEDAAKAYDREAYARWGEYTYLNFPGGAGC